MSHYVNNDGYCGVEPQAMRELRNHRRCWSCAEVSVKLRWGWANVGSAASVDSVLRWDSVLRALLLEKGSRAAELWVALITYGVCRILGYLRYRHRTTGVMARSTAQPSGGDLTKPSPWSDGLDVKYWHSTIDLTGTKRWKGLVSATFMLLHLTMLPSLNVPTARYRLELHHYNLSLYLALHKKN